jgi:hypothetical protein
MALFSKAPIVPVSAVTGQGSARLRRRSTSARPGALARRPRAVPALPIAASYHVRLRHHRHRHSDRWQTACGPEVEITWRAQGPHPRLQTHRHKVEEAVPGSRVAVNLSRVSTDELKRGEVVTIPGWLEPTQLTDARLDFIAGTPRTAPQPGGRVLQRCFPGASSRASACAHAASPRAERLGAASPGRTRPLVKGDRIIRQPSPSTDDRWWCDHRTSPRRRHRRFRPRSSNDSRHWLTALPPTCWRLWTGAGPCWNAPDRRGTFASETAGEALRDLIQAGARFTPLSPCGFDGNGRNTCVVSSARPQPSQIRKQSRHTWLHRWAGRRCLAG